MEVIKYIQNGRIAVEIVQGELKELIDSCEVPESSSPRHKPSNVLPITPSKTQREKSEGS